MDRFGAFSFGLGMPCCCRLLGITNDRRRSVYIKRDTSTWACHLLWGSLRQLLIDNVSVFIIFLISGNDLTGPGRDPPATVTRATATSM